MIVLLTVNHCQRLNGYLITGARSNRLRPKSVVTSWVSFVVESVTDPRDSRMKRAASVVTEKYAGVPSIGRSLRENVTRGQLPDRDDVVEVLKYSDRIAVAFNV